jgi:Lysyl oxidase
MRKLLPAICALALPALAADRPPDLVGTPDLIVDSKTLQNHWIVRDEDFVATACDAIEGGISAGTHRVIRFTVSTPNVGDADIFIGDPNVHFQNNDGLYEFATCHHHFHFRHYALYQLIDPASGHVWRAAKRGFCMIDVSPAPVATGAVKTWAYRNCGRVGIPGNQGISHGWADVYAWQLQGQMFVLDGGDGQDPVPPGRYVIRITVNPPFVSSGPNDPCPFTDKAGFCHQLPEFDYTNNVGEAVVDIPDHPGKTGVGPGKNDPALHDSDMHDDAGEPID